MSITETFDHLEALIPPKSSDERYEHRSIGGFEDYKVLDYARDAGRNVLIYGPTGPGKTTMVYAWAAARGLAVINIPCNGAIDPSVLFGAPVMDEDGKIRFEEGLALRAIRQGKAVIYFDEVNFMPPKIAAMLHGLLDERRTVTLLEKQGEMVKAHPDLTIIATMNPDYEGVRPLNAAFRNRFAIQVKMDYEREIEEKIVPLEGTSAASLLDLADRLREGYANGALETPVSTNMLIEFVELGVDLSYEFAKDNFVNRFQPHERGAVTEALDLHEVGIKAELSEARKALADKE